MNRWEWARAGGGGCGGGLGDWKEEGGGDAEVSIRGGAGLLGYIFPDYFVNYGL